MTNRPHFAHTQGSAPGGSTSTGPRRRQRICTATYLRSLVVESVYPYSWRTARCWKGTFLAWGSLPFLSWKSHAHTFSITIFTETLTGEKIYNSQDFDFLSVELRKRKRKRKKISGILFLFVSVACCCSLHLPQHDNYQNKCEIKAGGIYLPFHYESDSEIKSPDFHL